MAGRPTKFNEDIAKKIIELLKSGKTNKQACEIIGITEPTFYNWQKSQPLFFYAVKEAKQETDLAVEASLLQRAMGWIEYGEIEDEKTGEVKKIPIKQYPPDPTSMIFWLKNRKPETWRDKTEVENTGHLMIAPATRDELIDYALEARKEKEAKKLPEGEDEE